MLLGFNTHLDDRMSVDKKKLQCRNTKDKLCFQYFKNRTVSLSTREDLQVYFYAVILLSKDLFYLSTKFKGSISKMFTKYQNILRFFTVFQLYCNTCMDLNSQYQPGSELLGMVTSMIQYE